MNYQMLLLKILILAVLFYVASYLFTKSLWYFGVKGRFGSFKKLWHAVAWFLCGLICIVAFSIIAIVIKV